MAVPSRFPTRTRRDILALLVACVAPVASAAPQREKRAKKPQDAPSKPDEPEKRGALEEYCLLVEPKDGPQVVRPISGAKMTGVVPARETSIGGARYYTKEEFDALGFGWTGFEKRAAEAADRFFATLKPEISKDAKGFVKTALYRSKSQLTSTLAFSPRFYEVSRTAMGDDLVLLIPDRHTVHVFPRPLGEYKDLGKKILQAYEDAAFPVSYEVLVLNRNGLTCLGSFKTE